MWGRHRYNRRLASTLGKARARSTAEIRALVEDLPGGLAGTRDRALIPVGFALGLRASDLVWLDVTDLTPATSRPVGLDVLIRHSKTDQDGAGETLALAPGVRQDTCPVRAVARWVEDAGIATGPLFREVGKGQPGAVGAGRMHPSSVARVLTGLPGSPGSRSPGSRRTAQSPTGWAFGRVVTRR